MNDFTGLYDIRDYKPEDRNFILATFLRGLYYGDFFFGEIPKQTFMDNYKHVIETLINISVIKVACLKEDPDVIIGYSILSQDYQTLHWLQVKKQWREKGIGRSLTPKKTETVSHLSKLGLKLLPKLNGAVFNPFKLS
jgi:hypothetical protein